MSSKNQYKNMYWTTNKGNKIHLSSMDTDYVFNCLKIMYNYLAIRFDLQVIKPYTSMYDKDKNINKIRCMKALKKSEEFITIIDRRGDIPYEYDEEYDIIKKVLNNPYTRMRIISK